MSPRTVAAFAVGPLATAVLGFITVPLLAWHFSPEDVGRNTMLQQLTSFALLVFVLGLDQAFVREFHESSDWHRLFRACVLPSLLLALVTFALAFPAGKFVSLVLYDERSLSWYALSAGTVLAALATRFLSLVLRMQERAIEFSISQVIPKLAMLVAIAVLAVASHRTSFAHLITATLLANLCAITFLAWSLRRELRRVLSHRVDLADVRSVLVFGAPLIGGGIAYWALTSTASLALRAFADMKALGVYAVTMSFAGVATVFQMIFATVWMPTVYKWVAAKEDMTKLDDALRLVVTAACIISSVIGTFSWLADFLLPRSYAQVKFLVVACVMPSVFYAVSEVTVVGVNIARRTGIAASVAFGALAINVLLSAALAPRFGPAGAAAAAAIAFAFFFVLRTEASIRLWRPISRTRPYLLLTVLLLFALGTCLIQTESYTPFAIGWGVLLTALLIFFRRDLRQITNYLRT